MRKAEEAWREARRDRRKGVGRVCAAPPKKSLVRGKGCGRRRGKPSLRGRGCGRSVAGPVGGDGRGDMP